MPLQHLLELIKRSGGRLFSDGPTSSVANKIISSNIRGLAGDIREQEAKIRSVGPSAIIGDWEKTVR